VNRMKTMYFMFRTRPAAVLLQTCKDFVKSQQRFE